MNDQQVIYACGSCGTLSLKKHSRTRGCPICHAVDVCKAIELASGVDDVDLYVSDAEYTEFED